MENTETLAGIVRAFASQSGRPEQEVQSVLESLDKNWISSINHWALIPPDLKRDLGLPLALHQHLDDLASKLVHPDNVSPQHVAPTRRKDLLSGHWKYCYFLRASGKIYFNLNNVNHIANETDKLETFLPLLGEKAEIWTDDGLRLSGKTELQYAIRPGRVLLLSPTAQYKIKYYNSFRAVDSWLTSLGLEKYVPTFEKEGIDDFLGLPFLRVSCLDDLKVHSPDDRRTLTQAISALQEVSPPEFIGLWLKFLGFGSYSKLFSRNMISLQVLLLLREEHLRASMKIKDPDCSILWEIIKDYKQFSSVEGTSFMSLVVTITDTVSTAVGMFFLDKKKTTNVTHLRAGVPLTSTASYDWLKAHGFDRYAFQFVRYNIPLYALPLVNFFIVGEMGVAGDSFQLLRALSQLKDSPEYNVKAIAYWLRDLELADYIQAFAKQLMVNFVESLTILTDHQIARLLPQPQDRQKLKTAVREMKEFRYYYSLTASLLSDPIIEKHSARFAEHGASLDLLSLMTDQQLQEIGVTSAQDRHRILEAGQKLKLVPSGVGHSRAALRLFGNTDCAKPRGRDSGFSGAPSPAPSSSSKDALLSGLLSSPPPAPSETTPANPKSGGKKKKKKKK